MTAWILTPCKRSRLEELRRMLTSLEPDPQRTAIVTTQPDPIQPDDLDCHLLTFLKIGMLFGEWLNFGLDFIHSQESGEYEVLHIGSSLIGSPQAAGELLKALAEGHSMAGPDLHHRLGLGAVRTLPPERTVHDRIPGMCFAIRGELGIRFDPEFRWWYSDDDFEMQARQLAPVALVGANFTYPAQHKLNEIQAIHATEDREKFIKKWKYDPW